MPAMFSTEVSGNARVGAGPCPRPSCSQRWLKNGAVEKAQLRKLPVRQAMCVRRVCVLPLHVSIYSVRRLAIIRISFVLLITPDRLRNRTVLIVKGKQPKGLQA